MVYSDVNYLSSTAPPAASEWTSLLRPLRGREPEGLWNLLSIVREMLRRHDRNYIPLLKVRNQTTSILKKDSSLNILIAFFTQILTEEILTCETILLWWFNTNVSLHRGFQPNSSGGGQGGGGNGNNNNRSSIHSNIHASQHACSSLCDEIVVLWRLVTLNPALPPQDTAFLFDQLREYHLQTLAMVVSASTSVAAGTRHQNSNHQQSGSFNGSTVKTADIEIFSGFKPAMISCLIDWTTYPISGVTNAHKNPYCPSINAASSNTSTVNHAISGTVKMTPWSSKLTTAAGGSISFCKQSSTESSANGGGEEESPVKRGLNDSEDSGNNENWDRVSSVSGGSDEIAPTARPAQQQPVPEEAEVAAGPSNAASVNADYQIYVYSTAGQNVKNVLTSGSRGDAMKNYEPALLAAATVKPIEDSFEILFSRAEALYAHGYVKEACQLSVRLAEELLSRPPVLTLENAAGSDQQQQSGSNNNQTAALGTATLTSASNMSLNNGGRSHVKRAPRPRFNPALHQISLLASATLSKAAFLCAVLSEHEDSHLLAFHVGLLGLELVRPPASTKALEVKLANQEQELVNSLKRIPLCSRALAVLREKGEQLRDGRLTTRGDALLPLILAGYIFDALVLSTGQGPVSAAYALSTVHSSFSPGAIRLPTDERLAFEASVAAIGLKANVSEADHPLLCEGTRRQRGDLALTLLVFYKDNKDRLNKIMDKLLDKEIHMINRKSQSNNGGCLTSYMLSEASTSTVSTKVSSSQNQPGEVPSSSGSSPSRSVQPCQNYQALETNVVGTSSEAAQSKPTASTSNWDEEIKSWESKFQRLNLVEGTSASTSQPVNVSTKKSSKAGNISNTTGGIATATSSSVDSASPPETASSDNSPTVSRRNIFQATTSKQQLASDSSSSGESSDSFSSTSSTEKKSPIHRSSNLVAGPLGSSTPHHHLSTHSSSGTVHKGATVSSSAEISYSEHLSATPPTIVELSNGQSRGSTFESFNAAYMAPGGWTSASSHNTTLTNSPAPTVSTGGNYTRPSMSNGGGAVPKNSANSSYLQGNGHNISHLKRGYPRGGKRGHYPVIPNTPSEASAHFMFELAKTVLAKAGGNNTSVLFTQPPSSSNGRAHRNLHMCAFQIGLYALGLHNAVSPNWLSRTYSSQVSWITAQAMEIGHQAIAFLIDTWEGHFTPNEVASLADRASRGQEQSMVTAAAQLALSCLPHSHALTPSEIQRALIQCKEQSTEMLERACLAVESAAQGGGVNPDVLFHVARKWYELYDQEVIKARHDRFEGRTPREEPVSATMARVPVPAVQQPSVDHDQMNPGNVDLSMSGEGMVPPDAPYFYYDPTHFLGDIPFSTDPNSATSAEMSVSGNGHHALYRHHHQSSMYPPSVYHHHNHHQAAAAAVAAYHQSNSQFTGNMSTARYYQGAVVAAMTQQNQQQVSVSSGRYFTSTPSYGYQTGMGGQQGSPAQTQTPTLVPLSFSPYTANQFYQLTPLSAGNGSKQPMVTTTAAPPHFFGYHHHPQMNGGGVPFTGQQQSMGPNNGGRPSAAYILSGAPPSVAPFYAGGAMSPYHGNPYLAYPNTAAMNGPAVSYMGGQQHLGMVHPVTVHTQPAPASSSASSHSHLTARQLSYMHSVYRVGRLAMDTLARRVNDDRPQTKYAKNPTYCEDVKWLLMVAKKLGM